MKIENQPWGLPDAISHLAVLAALVLQIPWYWYLVLSFVDVQGNYLGEYKKCTFQRDTKCNLCS
jgi:hypothetical protein